MVNRRKVLTIAWTCPSCKRSGTFEIFEKTPALNIGKALVDAHRGVQPMKQADRCPLERFQFRSFAGDAKAVADLYAEMRP